MQVNNKPQNQTPCHSTFNNCHHNVYQRPRLLQHFIPVESWWKLSARPNLWNGNLTCHNLGLFLDLECDWTTVLHTHTSILRLFFWDHVGEPVPAELLDFAVQGKINRGRQTDHPAGRHSIRTKQCPPPPSPIFFTGRMPYLPPNQQRQSTEGKQ